MESWGDECTWVCDCSCFCCNSFKPFSEPNDSLRRSPVVHHKISVFWPYGAVAVLYQSHNRVHGEVWGGVLLFDGCLQLIPHWYIYILGQERLEIAAYFGPIGGTREWLHFEQSFNGYTLWWCWWRYNADRVRNCTTSCWQIPFHIWNTASPQPLLWP